MVEPSISEEYEPGFKAAGQAFFVEENNFFYPNYEQKCPTMSPRPAELLPPAQPPPFVTDNTYNCPNFLTLGVYHPPIFPSQFIPSPDPAIFILPPSEMPGGPLQPLKTPKKRKTALKRKRTASNEKEVEMDKAIKEEDTAQKEKEDEEAASLKKVKEEVVEQPKEGDKRPPKKKKQKKTVRREGLADWDFQHRKEFQSYEKGALLVKCTDAESDRFGKEIWLVDNYQLVNKYVMERDDPYLGRIFVKTERYSGWMSDESWSYYQINGTAVDEERIGVMFFPTENTIRDFCVMEKVRNPFYEELMERLREQKQEEAAAALELEEGEVVSDKERQTIKEEPPEEDDDLDDLQELDTTQLFFYRN